MLFRSNDTATTEIYTQQDTLSLHDALPISLAPDCWMVHVPVTLGPDWAETAAELARIANPQHTDMTKRFIETPSSM